MVEYLIQSETLDNIATKTASLIDATLPMTTTQMQNVLDETANEINTQASLIAQIKALLITKVPSYSGTTWQFPSPFDFDAMGEYIRTYGESYGDGYMLAFDINFTIEQAFDGTSNYGRMEFHENGDEGTNIYYYYSSDVNDGYDHVGDWGADYPFDVQGTEIITLNEEPSIGFLHFLNTFATKQ